MPTKKKPVKKPVKKPEKTDVNTDAAITERVKKNLVEKGKIDEKAKASRKEDHKAKPAPHPKPTKYAEKYPITPEEPKTVQPNLYGAADQILNTLETALAYWKKQYTKFMNKKEKAEEQIDEALEIINDISLSIKGTVDQAPKLEDPAPPGPKIKPSAPAKKGLDPKKDPIVTDAGPETSTDTEKEFRKPQLMPTLDKCIKVGMLLQPNFQDDKLLVEEILGPKDTVQSSITFTLVECPPCYSLLLSDPSKGSAVYVHNLIMFDDMICSIFLADKAAYDIVGKPSKDGKDPY